MEDVVEARRLAEERIRQDALALKRKYNEMNNLDLTKAESMSAEEFYDMLDDACKKDPNLLDKMFDRWTPPNLEEEDK